MILNRKSCWGLAGLLAIALGAGCAGGGGSPPILRQPEIAFMHEDPNESLKIMNTDGTNVRTVLMKAATGLQFEQTSLGPEGEQVVFTGFPSGSGSGVYIVNTDGTGLTRLANGGNPSFNGTQISFRDVGTGSDEALYVMDPDGTDVQTVATLLDDGVQFERTSLSPDGAFIVFEGIPSGGNIGVYRVNTDGTGLTRLADGQSCSTNGTLIAFVRRESTEETLFVMNADGTNVQTVLTKTGSGLELNETCINPAGTQIVFHGRMGGGAAGVYIVNVNGTSLTRLADGRNPSIR